MRAIVIPRNGPPEVFEERELPDRHLAPKDVRIRVEAAGVNFADLMARVGLYPDAPKEMPYAPGYEVAGTVEEVGAKVEPPIVVGARVVAATRFWGYADRVRTPGRGSPARRRTPPRRPPTDGRRSSPSTRASTRSA